MEKKRSVGVIVFGILLILSSLFNITGLNINGHRFLLQPLSNALIVASFIISAIALVAGIISGIGVFFLKDIFRKIALFVGGYTIFTYFVLGPLTFKNIPAFIDMNVNEMISTAPVLSESTASAIIWSITSIGLVVDFGFALCLVYFFTRPKVKEQFK